MRDRCQHLLLLLALVGASCSNNGGSPRDTFPEVRDLSREGVKGDSAPAEGWLFTAGGSGFDTVFKVVVDHAGNVIVGGLITGEVAFGSIKVTAADPMTLFLAKLDPSGKPLWALPLAGVFRPAGNNYWVIGLTVDAANNIYLVDSFAGTVTLAGRTLVSKGGRDGLVLKVDPDGKALWATPLGGPGDDWCYGIALDSQGQIAVGGSFQKTASFGGITLTSGAQDLYVARLDAGGAFVWATQGGGGTGSGPISNWVVGVTADGSGNTYVAGSALPGDKLGDITLPGLGPFAAKLDSAGKFLWAQSVDGHAGACGALDPAGNLLVSATALVGGLYCPLIAKLGSADGSLIWKRLAPSTGTVAAWTGSIVVDGAGRATVTGGFSGDVVLGTRTLTARGSLDGFVALLDPDGNITAAEQLGGDSKTGGSDIDVVLDKAGNLYLAGGFQQTASFGAATATSHGDADLFVWKRKALR